MHLFCFTLLFGRHILITSIDFFWGIPRTCSSVGACALLDPWNQRVGIVQEDRFLSSIDIQVTFMHPELWTLYYQYNEPFTNKASFFHFFFPSVYSSLLYREMAQEETFFSGMIFYLWRVARTGILERQRFTAHLNLRHSLGWTWFNVQRGCHGDVTGAKWEPPSCHENSCSEINKPPLGHKSFPAMCHVSSLLWILSESPVSIFLFFFKATVHSCGILKHCERTPPLLSLSRFSVSILPPFFRPQEGPILMKRSSLSV